MAQVINIQGTTAVDDPEYRYKMPAIIGKVEGRGNGIKTAIPNMTQVALALHRDPGEVTKFFGCELGAQTTWVLDTERSIVNGAHTTSDLQVNLFKYIEKFVLCPNCRLPETDYKVRNGVIYSACGACGAKEMVDMSHKLTTYILAQDKKNKKEKKKGKDDKDKKKKKGGAEEGEADDKDKKKKKDKRDKDKKKKKKKKSKDEEGDEGGGAAEDDEEAESPEEEEGEGSPGGAEEGEAEEEVEDEDLLTPKEAVTAELKDFLAANPTATAAEVVSTLRDKQASKMMPLKECAYIAMDVLFDEAIVKEGQVAKHAAVLQNLAQTDANGFMARHIIGAVELFFGHRYPSLAKGFPLVLKQMYDEDILDEDFILAWADAGITYDFSPQELQGESLKELRALAEPCVNWLREADEDEDEED